MMREENFNPSRAHAVVAPGAVFCAGVEEVGVKLGEEFNVPIQRHGSMGRGLNREKRV